MTSDDGAPHDGDQHPEPIEHPPEARPHVAPAAPGEWPTDPHDPAAYPDEGANSLASVGQRALARITDFFLSVMLPSGIILAVFQSSVTEETAEGTIEITNVGLYLALLYAGIAIAFVYEFGLIAWKGQTVGKMLGRLRVADLDTGGPPDVRAALIRAALPVGVLALAPFLDFVASLAYLVVYLSGMLDRELRRGWHDKLAGTVVVRLERPERSR